MNVALISSEYPPFNNVGGIATFMSGLAKHLTKSGHQVIVFTDGGHYLTHQTTIDGVTIVPFLNRNNNKRIKTIVSLLPCKLIISILQEYSPNTFQLLCYNFLALFTFISYSGHAKLHVIHTPVLFAPALLISFVFPTIPIVAHAQGPDELLQPYNAIAWDSWETRLKAQIEALYMLRSRFIIPCSQIINDYLEKKYHAVRKKLVHIPNFVDTKTFPPSKKSLDTNTLLFIGRMEYRKGPDLVVQAFAKLIGRYPKIKLILFGKDTSTWFVNGKPTSFSRYVKSLRLPAIVRSQITYIPRIDDRAQLLKRLNEYRGIAILPSRYEPFGFVFIETMMAGYITIASKRGGGNEIIENDVNGFLVEPTIDDIVACVQKIKRLTTEQLTRLTSRAKKHIISTYDVSRVEGFYRKLYSLFSTQH